VLPEGGAAGTLSGDYPQADTAPRFPLPLPRLLPSSGLSRRTEPPAAEISRILRKQIFSILSHPALNTCAGRITPDPVI